MGKVETSAATLLSELSAVLIRRLVAATPTVPLTVETLKATIDNNDQFQCFRTALDDFQPVPLPTSILSKHLKKAETKKRKRAPPKKKAAVAKVMEHVEPAFAAQVHETTKATDEVILDEEDYD